jgi:hypothetical protein
VLVLRRRTNNRENVELVMPIEQRGIPMDPKQIATITRRLLEASTLCSIASVCDDGRPHINAAYFARADGLAHRSRAG